VPGPAHDEHVVDGQWALRHRPAFRVLDPHQHHAGVCGQLALVRDPPDERGEVAQPEPEEPVGERVVLLERLGVTPEVRILVGRSSMR